MDESPARPVNSAFAAQEPLAERLLHTLGRYLAQAGTLPEDGLDSAQLAAQRPRTTETEALWREQFLDRLFSNLHSEIESARRDNKENTQE